ncbi:hypothetical protein ABZ816_40120 [Actinosynnema sp. NPDC047251]|uniref:Putative membrane protein n=1 Tax=Saccharothrix espanaensis (strain ATCC 51144 / DSM 44229 / JCM 9112 / NBRC 15066 / NRRL 15764) TaxID=1179773 RepID=K0JYP9_SACES|nr:hypothetical protein [Saccharothrix espanaensis]CCH29358.1 putative membrane protein [Saccharothrix espanaensis DSM 44229]
MVSVACWNGERTTVHRDGFKALHTGNGDMCGTRVGGLGRMLVPADASVRKDLPGRRCFSSPGGPQGVVTAATFFPDNPVGGTPKQIIETMLETCALEKRTTMKRTMLAAAALVLAGVHLAIPASACGVPKVGHMA